MQRVFVLRVRVIVMRTLRTQKNKESKDHHGDGGYYPPIMSTEESSFSKLYLLSTVKSQSISNNILGFINR